MIDGKVVELTPTRQEGTFLDFLRYNDKETLLDFLHDSFGVDEKDLHFKHLLPIVIHNMGLGKIHCYRMWQEMKCALNIFADKLEKPTLKVHKLRWEHYKYIVEFVKLPLRTFEYDEEKPMLVAWKEKRGEINAKLQRL